MKIGIDIDYTLTNIDEMTIVYGQIFAREFLEKDNLIDPIGYNIYEKFDWNDEQYRLFWKKYGEKMVNVPPRPFSAEIIKKLKKEGHTIYILTSRNSIDFKDPYDFSKKWLDKYNILYDDLIVGLENKDEICEKLGIDIFVDDSIKYCSSVSNLGIKTYLFYNIYNRNMKNDKIEMVYSWIELYDKIQEYLKSN
jgi:uncharacterized HAD superfamily protein